VLGLAFASCDRMVTSRRAQLTEQAEAKANEGKYLEAINLYEAALDGSDSSADVHYQLGLLYDDKMNDPLNALHHFKRFLTLTPTGRRAEEVKTFMKRDQLTLLTQLSGDTMVTQKEAASLRNENLKLRQQLEARVAENKAERAAAKAAPVPRSERPPGKQKIPANARTYTVQRGDTLASISRKFYKTPTRWKKILQANKTNIDNPEKLKIGQDLIIP
jgi:tetratricopeptide (TPR) repeat protein